MISRAPDADVGQAHHPDEQQRRTAERSRRTIETFRVGRDDADEQQERDRGQDPLRPVGDAIVEQELQRDGDGDRDRHRDPGLAVGEPAPGSRASLFELFDAPREVDRIEQAVPPVAVRVARLPRTQV